MSLLRNHSLLIKPLEPETRLTIARMTVKPDLIDTYNYDAWIKEIKFGHGLPFGANNLSTVFRLLQISACHHPQVATLNWVTTGLDGVVSQGDTPTPGGSLVHQPYKYTASSGTSYINFSHGLLLDSLRFNCTFGQYNYNDESVGQAWGSGQTNGNWNVAIVRNSPANTISCRINTSTLATTVAITPPAAQGLLAAKRTSNTMSLWLNGVSRASVTANDIGAIVNTLGVGVHGLVRNGDVVGEATQPQESIHFYGTFAINLAVMKTSIENYMAKYP